MKIEKIDILPVRLPLKAVATLSRGVSRTIEEGKQVILVKMTGDDGTVGWGEAGPSRRWSAETTHSSYSTIKHYLAPALLKRDPLDIAGLHATMNTELAPGLDPGQPVAKAALDMAAHARSLGFVQRQLDQRAQPRLWHPLGGGVDRSQHLLERRVFLADAAIFGVDDLESKRAAPDLTEATDAGATSQICLLRTGEIEETKCERPGAVSDAAQQLPPPPIRNFGELDFTLHDHPRAVAHAADVGDLSAVFVTRWQHEQQVLYLRDAELREFVGERRPYTAQA
jgi:hypothetical protein